MAHKVALRKSEHESRAESIEKPKESSSKSKRLYTIGAAFVAILLLFTSLNIMISATTSSIPTVIEPGSMVGDANYVIFKDSATYYAKNGTTGAIDLKDSNASYVIQTCIGLLGLGGGRIVMTGGTFILNYWVQIRGGQDGVTLEWSGCEWKLDDLGVEQACILIVTGDNATLINPSIDGDRNNNEISPLPGGQTALQLTMSANDTRILGGHIKDAPLVGVGGSSTNAFIDGLKISNSGEHGFYIGSYSGNVVMRNCVVYHPGQSGYGYGFKITNITTFSVDNGYIEFTGIEGYSTAGVVMGNGASRGYIQCTVKNAVYGFFMGGKSWNGTPNNGITISIDCINCNAFDFAGADPSDNRNVRIVDSTMDRGCLNMIIGNGTVVDGFRAYGVVSVYTSPTEFNVSYSLINSNIICTGGWDYMVQLKAGDGVLIDNCYLENQWTGSSGTLHLSTMGNVTVSNCVIVGADVYGVYVGGDVYAVKFIQNRIGLLSETGVGPNTCVVLTGSDTSRHSLLYNTIIAGSESTLVYYGGTPQLEGNIGYVSENSGNKTITGAFSTVTVDHGLATMPILVVITVNNTGAGNYSVSSITSTQFIISFTNQPATSEWKFYWYAKV